MGRSSSRKKRTKQGKYKTPRRPSTPIPPSSEARKRLNFDEFTLYPKQDKSNSSTNQDNYLFQTNGRRYHPSSTHRRGGDNVDTKNCGVVASSSMYGLIEDRFTSQAKPNITTSTRNVDFIPSPKRVYVPSSSYQSNLRNANNNTKHHQHGRRDQHTKKLVTLGDAISEIDSMDHSSINAAAAAATTYSKSHRNGSCHNLMKLKNNSSTTTTIATTHNTSTTMDDNNKENVSLYQKNEINNVGKNGNQRKKFGISFHLLPSSSSRSQSKHNNMYQMKNQMDKLRKRFKTKLHFQRGRKSIQSRINNGNKYSKYSNNQQRGLYDLNGNIVRDDFSLSSPISNYYNEKGFDK